METDAPPSTRHLFRIDRRSMIDTVRTTVAAAASLLAGRALGLPEAYWSVMTTIIVMQSSLGAAWQVSWQRLIGTALGGITGAAVVTLFATGWIPFIAGMLVMGLPCALLPLGKSAYRFAGMTLAVVMLPSRTAPIWTVATHRFLEVAIGIMVGMAVMALWREEADASTASS